MSKYLFLVFSAPVVGMEAEFNRWYDQQHLPDVIASPGFVSAQRFRVIDAKPAGSFAGTPYAAVYEMECDDPQHALAELREAVRLGQVPISEGFDRETVRMCLLEPIEQA